METYRKVGRNIFHTVDCYINIITENRLLDFFYEEPLAAHLRKGDVQNHVSRCFYFNESDIDPWIYRLDLCFYPFCLPEGKFASTGPNRYLIYLFSLHH